MPGSVTSVFSEADEFGAALHAEGLLGLPPGAFRARLTQVALHLTANVRGPLVAIRAFAPLLRATGDGVIVNISSVAAQSSTGSSIIYGASKAALNTMSMALARVRGPEIRIVVVAPGMVHPDFVPGRTEAKAALATSLKRGIEAWH